VSAVNKENVKYLLTKQQKMGHWLPSGFDEAFALADAAAASAKAGKTASSKKSDAQVAAAAAATVAAATAATAADAVASCGQPMGPGESEGEQQVQLHAYKARIVALDAQLDALKAELSQLRGGASAAGGAPPNVVRASQPVNGRPTPSSPGPS
jgi:hypothetical protein